MRALLLGFVSALSAAVPAAFACEPSATARGLAETWMERRPAAAFPWPEGCAPTDLRDEYVVALGAGIGYPVGYKAGLTTRASQARFGTDEPLLGILHSEMILADGAAVDAAFGARGLWEADFVLVVKDDGINSARTREEALAHLRGFMPFIELPDLLFAPETTVTAPLLASVNVGARLGVVGDERPLPAGGEGVAALADMRVRAFDGSGALLAEGKGSDALGHPLDVVLWVRDAVHGEGGRLEAGDIISVGAFTPLTPPKAGQTVRVRYEGLPGEPEVSVSFR